MLAASCVGSPGPGMAATQRRHRSLSRRAAGSRRQIRAEARSGQFHVARGQAGAAGTAGTAGELGRGAVELVGQLVGLSIHPFICLSIYLSICPFLHPSILSSVHPCSHPANPSHTQVLQETSQALPPLGHTTHHRLGLVWDTELLQESPAAMLSLANHASPCSCPGQSCVATAAGRGI